jgi:hypothetical protein
MWPILLAYVSPGSFVHGVFHLQSNEKFLSARAAIDEFPIEPGPTPLDTHDGGDRQLFIEDQTQPVHGQIREPGVAAAARKVGTAHLDREVGFKSRSVSPIHVWFNRSHAIDTLAENAERNSLVTI